MDAEPRANGKIDAHAPLHAPVTIVRPAVAQYMVGGHGVHALTFCKLMAVE
jgi:hypothetical protein